MDNSITYDLLIIFFIILVNAFFVSAEVSLLTSRSERLEKIAVNSKGATLALKLASEPEKFLSSVQVGITLMSILLGFYSGATITDELETILFYFIGEYADPVSDVIVILIITYFTVLGEIIPKRIAMLYPEKIAVFSARGIKLFILLSYPFSVSLSIATKIFLRIFRIKQVIHPITTEELKLVVNQAEHFGTVEKTERDMIRRLVHLSDMTVGAVMTPRSELICLNTTDSLEVNLEKIFSNPFNYFPVIENTLENVLGVIFVKDLINEHRKISHINIQDFTKKILYVPEQARLTNTLELFKDKQTRLAMVIDEYGDIKGLITLNDIIKTFVGDLATLVEGQKPNIVERQDGSYLVSGNVAIEEIMEIINVTSLPGDEEEDYRTLASFILKQFNEFPKVGDNFEAIGWKFQIAKMTNFKIERVLLSKL